MTGGSKRLARVLGVGILAGSVAIGVGAGASISSATVEPTPSATPTAEPGPPSQPADGNTLPESKVVPLAEGVTPPYGEAYPITIETNFARPKKSISSAANSDFSQLDDLERLIRGSYYNPVTKQLRPDRAKQSVYMSISRMENSYRVGRELIKAAKYGVRVRVIHGKASQSKESRALQKALSASGLRDSQFKICEKGRSLACLSGLAGAIMHSKILYITSTYTRDNKYALGAIWSGSANLGGPSGERTYNNGWTVYNDKLLNYQVTALWGDMYAERNIGNNYPAYVAAHPTKYGYSSATAEGYSQNFAYQGMFYSSLSNVTIYPTPIYATPTNGRDPVINVLNRVVPDDDCRIRVQHNRFKYRRIAVAQKLVELADKGCKVSAISFYDDLKVNRDAHCQMTIRICRPILDVFRSAETRIEAAVAKPHDKTMLIEATMTPNRWNTYERLPNGDVWPTAGAHVKMVQAGSAALTGSNLVVSDEITTETTDAQVYEDYLGHWNAIWKSNPFYNYAY